MNLGVRGNPPPLTHRPPSATGRRPHSARIGRNPITGEEYLPAGVVESNKNDNSKNSKTAPLQNQPQSVPSLNLRYLRDNEETSGAMDVSLREYKLDTPNSASTVSWGTPRSAYSHRPVTQNQARPQGTTVRPDDVPGLSLGFQEMLPPARKAPKQPTVWDKDPVPDNLPAPSARYKELYQQYAEDIKKSLKSHAGPKAVSQEDVESTVQAMKLRSQQQQPAGGDNLAANSEDEVEDTVDESWKKQRYTANQLRKKLDAEELLENNKKLKLVETVMIDQLSRAVISDPEQDQRNKIQGGSTTRRTARGTNRFLHDSRVSTRGTATENLLSRRVRFGARIIARNGRDAVRELTGFFFQVDHSMTVYEFKQFGKSAKAIPFIQRGVFCHPAGPKAGLPYSLTDIYTGGDMLLPTEGQPALSAELTRSKYLTLRVTDVDDAERAELLTLESDDYADRGDEASKIALENRHFLHQVQEAAQEQIRKRGIKTITGLGRHYRQLDGNRDGVLLQHDLEQGLLKFHIDLPPQVLEQVFEIVDPQGERRLDYSVFMRTVLGEMNEFRKSLVRKAFSKVDTHKQGSIHLSDIKKFFNANCSYKPGSDADSTKSALQAFLDAVCCSDRQDEVSFIEFEEYYEGLSLSVSNDQDFGNILRNTWNI